MKGPLFVAGRSEECQNQACRNYGKRYYASRVWRYSLPQSSYGLDVLAFIGWQHEHEHRQLVEIQKELVAWLDPYRNLPIRVLATLSDGENTLIAALKTCWPQVPHQRCQVHFLNNLVDDILDYDDELRKDMRQDLGGLPKVPKDAPGEGDSPPLVIL